MSEEPAERVDLDFSGVRLALAGLRPREAVRLRREWAHFVSGPAQRPFLRLRVCYEPPAARPSPAPAFDPKRMRSTLRPDGARFVMPEGRAEVGLDGRGELHLRAQEDERLYWVMHNLLRSSLAWSLPSRGGALMHAAGLVIAGRGFLLIGPEGSGKTTWARLGEAAGQHVLTDDLAMVDGSRARLEVLGSPFRSDHLIVHRRGRWPLGAILFPEHGTPPATRPVSRIRAQARIAANLPFVADALERDGRLPALIDRLVREVPCRALRFGLEPSFVDLLRELE